MRARGRWFALAGVRLAGLAGALLGLILLARAPHWPAKVLGGAIILAALAMTASVTGHLARAWRTR